MKKIFNILFIFLIFTSFAYANFDDNFKKSIKNLADIEIEVLFKKELVSFASTFFVIGQTKSGDIFPVITNKQGTYFIGLSPALHLNQADSSMIREEIAKASLAKEKQDSSALNKLFKEFKENDFIFLEGNKKNLPTKIVVSDPDCPYCREHLSKIEKELETSNIKLIFAPVHDKNAFIKSQLAMQEISKLPQHDTPAKLKVLRKYYQNIKLNTQEMKTDYSQITKNKEKIFASGIIRGVPFIFEEQQ